MNSIFDFGCLKLDDGSPWNGRLKISIGRPGLLRPEDGTTKAKGRSSCAGLGPTRMAKVNLPSFAKATKGFSLSTALVTEEIYVQAGTEAEALAFANLDKPRGAGGKGFYIDALGH